MRSNPLKMLLLAAIAGLPAIPREAAAQNRPVTQEELLKQIESLSPAGTDPGRSAPNRNARPGGNSGGNIPLFPEKKEAKPAKVEKKAKGPTEIVALEASFDQKAHIAIFTGQVVVTDPEFTVMGDKLTAYLKHDDKPADGAAPKAGTPGGKVATPSPGAAAGTDKEKDKDKPGKSGGLDKALVEADPGKVVTVTQEKEDLEGNKTRSIGHGKKVHYDSVTGDITLYGKPDVQQGINTCVATEEGTIMILNRDGKMRVTGAHKTIIAEKLDK